MPCVMCNSNLISPNGMKLDEEKNKYYVPYKCEICGTETKKYIIDDNEKVKNDEPNSNR